MKLSLCILFLSIMVVFGKQGKQLSLKQDDQHKAKLTSLFREPEITMNGDDVLNAIKLEIKYPKFKQSLLAETIENSDNHTLPGSAESGGM